MASQQDSSVGYGVESVYKTGVTPTRWLEFLDESLDWNKNVKQGQGLRVGSRVARSARRVVPTADGGGDISYELASKGFGLLLQALFGTGVSTLVSGTTYQQLFTLGDTPSSLTTQKGLVDLTGTVQANTFLGTMFDSFEFNFAHDDIASLKVTADAGDITQATAYTAPSYAAEPVNLFHFANATLATGALTAPTTTALASGATPTADVRGATVAVANNLANDRFNFGGAGRKTKPTRGIRAITGSMDIEYDSTTYQALVLNDQPMSLILTYTGGALSTGVETLQLVVPEIKFDGALPQCNGTDPIIQNMKFTGLDNLTAAQPIWCVLRTADNAL